MTAEQAKAEVLAVYPDACIEEFGKLIYIASRPYGSPLSYYHATEAAAWLDAQKELTFDK